MERRIAIIGAGPVGRALASGLKESAQSVGFGVRDPAAAKRESASSIGPVVSIADAVDTARVVILAVPFSALAELAPILPLAGGQVVVDATNAVGTPLPDGFSSVGEFVGSMLPAGVSLVKAFNTIGAEHLGDGRFEGVRSFLPIAGDDEGRHVVTEMAGDLGFEVADLGGREKIAMVEEHARLWIHLAFSCGWGREFGLAVVRR